MHITDPALRYVMQRYREAHDFIHAVTGCGRTVDEEVALKLFEWYHTGLPIGVLAVIGGAPHLNRQTFTSVVTTHRRWAESNKPTNIHGARQVLNYMVVPWEQLLELPHAEVLKLTGYTAFPSSRL
jgi:ubiquinone biosynthesis protein COQ4